uniref:Putative secreted peptide n=1 Tax=Anopheles braziliensis TaxID=58242 RepID=A0A2M3ZE96_9DIPT
MVFDALILLNITTLLSDYLLLAGESVRRLLALPSAPTTVAPSIPAGSAFEGNVDEPEPLPDFKLNILATGWWFVCETVRTVKFALDAGTRWLNFTEFQLLLLQIFSTVLLTLVVCIGLSWRKYGNRITNRFIRPSTAKEIEELKLSVARLNLPKEHTPRI